MIDLAFVAPARLAVVDPATTAGHFTGDVVRDVTTAIVPAIIEPDTAIVNTWRAGSRPGKARHGVINPPLLVATALLPQGSVPSSVGASWCSPATQFKEPSPQGLIRRELTEIAKDVNGHPLSGSPPATGGSTLAE